MIVNAYWLGIFVYILVTSKEQSFLQLCVSMLFKSCISFIEFRMLNVFGMSIMLCMNLVFFSFVGLGIPPIYY
jgi:hypothetical protein